jgi:hypothetical protein
MRYNARVKGGLSLQRENRRLAAVDVVDGSVFCHGTVYRAPLARRAETQK